MFYYFNQLLNIEALMENNRIAFPVAAMQSGVFGTRQKEFEIAARNFPLYKTMRVISYMRDCDAKSKGNERGTASEGDLLNELIAKILV